MIIEKASIMTIICGTNLPNEIKDILHRILNDTIDGTWK